MRIELRLSGLVTVPLATESSHWPQASAAGPHPQPPLGDSRQVPYTELYLQSSFHSSFEMGYGRLNEISPCGFLCLNIWSSVGETVWETLGGVALSEEVCP